MRTSGTTFLCFAVLLGLVGLPAVEGWTSYLQSLSPSTAPLSYPSTQTAEEEAPPGMKKLVQEQGDYLSYLSSPRPLLKSQGDYNVGTHQQLSQRGQLPVAQEIIKSTTATDYLSRLSSGNMSPSPSRQKVVYSASPMDSSIGATDYLSQLSARPRARQTVAMNEPTVHSEADPTLPTSTSHSSSDSPNGANYLSFLSSPALPTTSSPGVDSLGVETKLSVAVDATSTYLSKQTSQHTVKSSTPDPDPKLSASSSNPAAPLMAARPTSASMATSKDSYSPFGSKPKSAPGSHFSAVGTSYMNFLGTGPSRTSWYAEPLYAKPMSRRKVERNEDHATTSPVKGPDNSSVKLYSSSPSSPTGTSGTPHLEESTHTSTTSPGYVFSIGHQESLVSVVENASSTPSPSSNTPVRRETGYLASLNTKMDIPSPNVGGNTIQAAMLAMSTSVAIPSSGYLSSLGRGKYLELALLQTHVAAQHEPSSSAQYLAALIPIAKASVSAQGDVGATSVGSANTSFAPDGRAPRAATESGYLSGLSSTSQSPLAFSRTVESGGRTKYSPFGKTAKAVAPTSYLSGLAGGDSSTPPSVAKSAVPGNFSPFGRIPKAVASEAEYLNRLTRRETGRSPAIGSSAPPRNYSPYGSKLKVVVSTGYLSELGSAPPTPDAPAETSPKSYSPFGRKPRAVKELGYLGTLAATSMQLSDSESIVVTSKSYSPFGRKPMASLEVGYLGSLSGVVPQVHAKASNEPPQLKTDATLLRTETKPSRSVLKPIASYHPVSGALVEIKSKR